MPVAEARRSGPGDSNRSGIDAAWHKPLRACEIKRSDRFAGARSKELRGLVELARKHADIPLPVESTTKTQTRVTEVHGVEDQVTFRVPCTATGSAGAWRNDVRLDRKRNPSRCEAFKSDDGRSPSRKDAGCPRPRTPSLHPGKRSTTRSTSLQKILDFHLSARRCRFIAIR